MVLGAGQAIEARVAVRGAAEQEAVRSIQALTGDTIDNIKGVPGVGESARAS